MSARRKAELVTGAAAIVLAIIVTVAVSSGGSSRDAAASESSTSTATTKIKRQDLVETDSADGTLGYADSRDVVNHLAGTVTWVAEEGSVVRPGQTLYKVDDKPVILMNGRQPVYRALSASSSESGPDVTQLERNLRRLGYDDDHDMTVDGEWDSGTTAAVTSWQEDHGLDESGSVELGRIAFAPGWRRVTSVKASLGNPPAAAVMTTSSNRQVVTVDLETSKASLAKHGAGVSVDVPTGPDVKGRITQVGTVAKTDASDEDSEKATIEVTIRLSEGATALDQAPVTVTFEQNRVKDALAIPVTALLAQARGKFAVEVVEGSERRLISVTPGVYASGFVEIEGKGLRAGMSVTNAAVK